MFVSRSNCVPPHDEQAKPSGRNSSIGRSYQASALCSSNTAAARSMSGRVSITCPHFEHETAGIGTPHVR